ncbi:MAG: hypothetical protein MRERC_4c041 [Mycoplasmataceae bacterium RC_NB112A]|nr:MAG: hypothetical protein MRERC_4c041 [Mycoplasmataceae bacterium RC_NB112A]
MSAVISNKRTLNKIIVRIFFYFFIFFLLLLVPKIWYLIIKKNIKSILFLILNPFYLIGELTFLIGSVLWLEYYLFPKMKLEIDNKPLEWLKTKLIIGIILSFFLFSKFFTALNNN